MKKPKKLLFLKDFAHKEGSFMFSIKTLKIRIKNNKLIQINNKGLIDIVVSERTPE